MLRSRREVARHSHKLRLSGISRQWYRMLLERARDPHGHHLDDALMKLKALARFAGIYGEAFHRIEALTEVDGRMKVIDMKIGAVRESVLVVKQSLVDLYRSTIAVHYDSRKQ